jgi:hypothetical protein
LNKWSEEGVWEDVWQEYLRQLDARGLIDWQETFIDATFMAAKRGVFKSARLAKGRTQSSWRWQAARVFQSVFSQRLRTLTKPLSQSKRSDVYGYLARDEVVPAQILLGS